jgi:hypothetical protein
MQTTQGKQQNAQKQGKKKPRKRNQKQKTKQNTNAPAQQSIPVAKASVPSVHKKPKIIRNKDGSVRVIHSEFVVDVKATQTTIFDEKLKSPIRASSGWEAIDFPINPGMPDFGEWISAFAPAFDKYFVNKACYRYEPVCSTSTTGTVMLSMDPDSNDDNPQTKNEVMTMPCSVRCVPWQRASLPIQPSQDAKLTKSYFVRQDAPEANEDIKLLDVGKFILSTVGVLSNLIGAEEEVALGELYVDYDITLTDPTLEHKSQYQVGSMLVSGDGVNPDALFGPSPYIEQNIDMFSYNPDSAYFTCLKAGSYQAFVKARGTDVGTGFYFSAISAPGDAPLVSVGEEWAATIAGSPTMLIHATMKLKPGDMWHVYKNTGSFDAGTEMVVNPCNYDVAVNYDVDLFSRKDYNRDDFWKEVDGRMVYDVKKENEWIRKLKFSDRDKIAPRMLTRSRHTKILPQVLGVRPPRPRKYQK